MNTHVYCVRAVYFSFKTKTKQQNKQTHKKHSQHIYDLSSEEKKILT